MKCRNCDKNMKFIKGSNQSLDSSVIEQQGFICEDCFTISEITHFRLNDDDLISFLDGFGETELLKKFKLTL